MEGWQGTQTATSPFPDAIFPAPSPAAGAELSAQAERGSAPFLEVLRTPAPAAGLTDHWRGRRQPGLWNWLRPSPAAESVSLVERLLQQLRRLSPGSRCPRTAPPAPAPGPAFLPRQAERENGG